MSSVRCGFTNIPAFYHMQLPNVRMHRIPHTVHPIKINLQIIHPKIQIILVSIKLTLLNNSQIESRLKLFHSKFIFEFHRFKVFPSFLRACTHEIAGQLTGFSIIRVNIHSSSVITNFVSLCDDFNKNIYYVGVTLSCHFFVFDIELGSQFPSVFLFYLAVFIVDFRVVERTDLFSMCSFLFGIPHFVFSGVFICCVEGIQRK